ncbi:MAG: leucyl aminopeptidase [Candidatus Koribacter versatilis]|uniref:Probable cytosol aminopeptidase n=1 Tax=Candidatus Korobacter versatilis TaxID=658062 RepID=A0A932A6E6_9BACT|nr:leucyl aminopeptidase [Candidatus Koribacter versatilis]
MKTTLITTAPALIETECLAVVALDHGEKDNNQPSVSPNDEILNKAASELFASGEAKGKMFEAVTLHRPAGLKAKRLLVIGGGKAKNFSSYESRKMAGTAVRFLKPKGIKSFAFVAPDMASGMADSVRSVVEGALVGDFDPDTYKSDRKDLSMQEMTVVAPASGDQKALQAALEQARIIGESQNFTRELVNEPGNRMTPTMLADRAKKMCEEVKSPHLKCEVLDGAKIRELKMGAFWSVSQGSDEPPALIVMTYTPPGAPAQPVLGLVGKGITFDSGGISIKPSDGMEKMKYDMAGGAAMIGAMRALALLQPKVKVIGIVCASENMPSGKAQKPGDVQIAMSGKSIEIINTDAEGRLVLADGLFYARQLGCTHLIDAATLTGACVVALGMINAGVFANDDAMYDRFRRALDRSGEKMWRLPLDPEYQEMIKSGIADIVNSGGRWGGAVTAAMFLKEFVDETPWIHLDIAGVAWMEENKSWIAKGPSGIAVRSLVEFVRGFAENGVPASSGRR